MDRIKNKFKVVLYITTVGRLGAVQSEFIMHPSRHDAKLKGGEKITTNGILKGRQTSAITYVHDVSIVLEDAATGGVIQM